jgi:Na+/melibiose symporter-like transporter
MKPMDARSQAARHIIAAAGVLVILLAWTVAFAVGPNNDWAYFLMGMLSVVGVLSLVVLWVFFWTNGIPDSAAEVKQDEAAPH